MAKKPKLEAHPVHLPNGDWGLRIEGEDADPQPGDTVAVKSKDGKEWTAVIDAIVSRNEWGVTCSRKPREEKADATDDNDFEDDDPAEV